MPGLPSGASTDHVDNALACIGCVPTAAHAPPRVRQRIWLPLHAERGSARCQQPLLPRSQHPPRGEEPGSCSSFDGTACPPASGAAIAELPRLADSRRREGALRPACCRWPAPSAGAAGWHRRPCAATSPCGCVHRVGSVSATAAALQGRLAALNGVRGCLFWLPIAGDAQAPCRPASCRRLRCEGARQTRGQLGRRTRQKEARAPACSRRCGA